MAVSDQVWMLENSIYSILSPEGFASILWKDSTKAAQAAKVMRSDSSRFKRNGDCREGVCRTRTFLQQKR